MNKAKNIQPITQSEARKLVSERRKEITDFEVKEKSQKITGKIILADDFVYAKKILLYSSAIKGDVDTRELIDFAVGRNKSVFIPKIHKATNSFRRFHFTGWENLIINEYGFREPVIAFDDDTSDIDLIIVPSMAVSNIGQRIGSGSGFYDKLLAKTFAPKYVLAFEFQLFSEIETKHHDVRIDKIITERRIIDTREKTLL